MERWLAMLSASEDKTFIRRGRPRSYISYGYFPSAFCVDGVRSVGFEPSALSGVAHDMIIEGSKDGDGITF